MAKSDPNRRVKDLVKFLRTERVSWQALTIGDVTIDGAQDLKLLESLPQRKPAAPERTIYERYGGALIENPAPPAETFLPVVEDDE